MKWTLFNIWITLIRKGTIADMSHKRRITCAPTSSLLLLITASCCCSCLPLSLMSPQMANSTSKWIASMLKKKNTLYVCPFLISAIGMNYKNTLTVALALAFNRKLAVCAAAGGWLGIGRWPSAMPTIAVMWVSVPKTWMGIPVVFPVATKRETKRCRDYSCMVVCNDFH